MMQNNSSLWNDAYRRLVQNKAAMIGGMILVFFILCAIFAPLIAPYSYSYQDLDLGASKPSWEHLLGTDVMGRDLLSRILYGARISLMVGFVATGVALVIGVSWGIIAGYFGGRVDSIMMRIVDVLYGLPFIIFIICHHLLTCFYYINQDYVVTSRGLISNADKTTCKRFAVAAVTLIISLSSTTRGAVNNSTVALAPIALVLNKLKTAELVLVNDTVIVSALPVSSDTKIDLITEVVAEGTVYKVVALVVVKSTFLFTNELAISL